MSARRGVRRYDLRPAMLRRILFCLLALALLNASPGFHWYDHSHPPAQAIASVQAHDEDEHSSVPEGAGEELACLDCVVQAQQLAPGSGVPVALAGPQPRHTLTLPPREERPQSPPAGRIRVRGPPSLSA
jgi:hypothetical protein